MVEVVLFEPEIPQNTGNIVRTCAVTGARLTLVEPLGFHVSNRALKRAGLDYWSFVDVQTIDDLETYLSNRQCYLFSSHAKRLYTEVSFQPDDCLVFGSETSGLPDNLVKKYEKQLVTLPMKGDARCLNLSNAVAIAVYEAWRQQNFS